MRDLFRTKPLAQLLAEADSEGTHGLKRTLGPWNLLSLGVGAIIGAGIFVLVGTAAARHAGPGIVLSFLLAGLGCAFAGLCYAEFASLIPVAGSAYTYGYATLGELFAWIIGWDLVLEYAFSAAGIASGWGGTLSSLFRDFGWGLDGRWLHTPGTALAWHQGHWSDVAGLQATGVDVAGLARTGAWFNLPAFLLVGALSALLIRGVKESATFNTVVVMLKVATVLVFIGLAAIFLFRNPEVRAANWHPFIPPNTGAFGSFGWSGIARGAGLIFFAYIGFDSVSTAAQEAKHPQRDMPIGILGSLAVCTVLYVLLGGLLTGVVHYTRLDVAAPVALGADTTGVGWGRILIKVGSLLGMSTAVLVTLLGQSRVFFSMSRDGLLPPWVGRVHPRWRTPALAQAGVGLFVATFGALIPIHVIGELVSIGTLLAFVIVCAGVWVLRLRQPDLPRAFRTPLVPFVPLMGIAISLLLMASLPADTWLRLVVWLAAGLGLYFGYGRRHSRLRADAPAESVPLEALP